jgi:hypothetical protein
MLGPVIDTISSHIDSAVDMALDTKAMGESSEVITIPEGLDTIMESTRNNLRSLMDLSEEQVKILAAKLKRDGKEDVANFTMMMYMGGKMNKQLGVEY